jgi:aminopeptidase
MKDSRINKLAKSLINYSCELKPGENILIETYGNDTALSQALVREAYKAGGNPFISMKNPVMNRVLLTGCNEEQLRDIASFEMARMSKMHAYIGIRSGGNISEMSGVPSDKMQMYQALVSKPVHSERRVKHTKWCVLRYPNDSMAQLAKMPTADFEDFYFNVCNLDYAKMSRAMDSLKTVMERTDKVRLVSPGTDLTFSIKGMPAIKCDGQRNIPDGEVYTAPLKTSVNGTITYNVTAEYFGVSYENVRLEFKSGKIVKATASSNADRISRIFDTDAGARYVGEFAIGVNPYIRKPMNDTLFDEKIDGSIHFTPGACYDECSNGNDSAIHWDMVLIQRPEYGGGEIWFDDVLVRKDGRFILPELFGLNPENLK